MQNNDCLLLPLFLTIIFTVSRPKLYTVSQKTSTFLLFKYLCQKLTDLIIFWCAKCCENLTSIACTFLTLPVYCSHFTLENPKKVIFQPYILQIIYVISEENKLLPPPPYPLHLKYVSALPCKMQNFYI